MGELGARSGPASQAYFGRPGLLSAMILLVILAGLVYWKLVASIVLTAVSSGHEYKSGHFSMESNYFCSIFFYQLNFYRYLRVTKKFVVVGNHLNPQNNKIT